jgi:predicted nucleic acid-binding protein
MTPRYIFDTGALIGAERGDKRSLDYISLVQKGRAEVLTPIVCIVEWWRGRIDRRDALLASVRVEALPLTVAKAAGVALGTLRARIDSKLSIDAVVMAFGALLDAPVVTSDLADLERFKPFFPGVRLLSLSRGSR